MLFRSSLTEAEVEVLSDRDRHRYEEFLQLADVNADGYLSPEEVDRRDALVILNNAGVPLLDDTADGSKGTGLMHHKFVVVDGQITIVTSANFTTSGIYGDFSQPTSRGNANNLLKIYSPELANLFTEEFNLMLRTLSMKLKRSFSLPFPVDRWSFCVTRSWRCSRIAWFSLPNMLRG